MIAFMLAAVPASAQVPIVGQGSSGHTWWFWGPVQGRQYSMSFYKNVPAFSISPGSTINYDIWNRLTPSEDMQMSLWMAPHDGANPPNIIGPWVQIFSSQTPSPPRGNAIFNDFELEYQSSVNYNFVGGNLAIRIKREGAWASSTPGQADQYARFSFGSQPPASDYFHYQVWEDTDGLAPYDVTCNGCGWDVQIGGVVSIPPPPPVDDNNIGVTANEDPGTVVIDAATDLYPNDPLIGTTEPCTLATVSTDCTSGNAAQNASAECRGLGLCHYPAPIDSCSVTTGEASCSVNGDGNPVLSVTSDWHGAIEFDYSNGGGTASVDGITINPISDGGDLTLVSAPNNCTEPLKDGTADGCTFEDEAITFQVSVSERDTSNPDDRETLNRIRVTGIPTAPSGGDVDAPGYTATTCGAGCVDITSGTSTLQFDTNIGIRFTPPLHWATTTPPNTSFVLGLEAFTRDNGAAEDASLGTNDSVRIEVQESADAPNLTINGLAANGIVSGPEDTTISLALGASLVDTDGSEQLIVQILNVPATAELTHGTLMGGVWTIPVADVPLVGFRWNPDPDHNDTNVTLTVNALAEEKWSFTPGMRDRSLATTSLDVEVQVNAVADVIPMLTVMDTSTDEDTPVQLDISAMLVDTDGSESLTYQIDGFGGATFTPAGVPGPGTSRIFSAADVAGGLMFNPIAHSDVDVTLGVTALATEARSTCSISGLECVFPSSCGAGGTCQMSPQEATGPEFIDIAIAAVADTPDMDVPLTDINANEGQTGVNLSALVGSTPDTDGSETCTVTITWYPADFVEPIVTGSVTFNAGMSAGASSWTVPCGSTGSGFAMNLPSNGHGTIQFCATASTDELNGVGADDTASSAQECFDVVIANTNETCNDGFNDPSEDCDDGAGNSDSLPNACRTTCQNPSCGDGVRDNAAPWGFDGMGEDCDAGAGNSDVQPDTCRTDCRPARCGDSVQDMFEACDDGNNGNQNDSCLDGCLAASCGDGFVQTGVEECDNGLANNDTMPDACRTSCMAAGCTDGVVDTGEACDDGNTNDGDSCPGTCQEAICGDGFTFIGMEECDQGMNNSDIQPDTCRTSCDLPDCGDGVVDAGEDCDDGNTVNEDACVNTCELNVCGDGFVDLATEECDEGTDNSNSEPDRCRPDCSSPFCGDGVVDSGESCDLGVNNDDNDPNGCRTNCALPGCGDGVVNPGEQCDDGMNNSNTDPDACRETCTLARCGDGVMDTGEVCDDGPANSNQIPNACRTNCLPSGCGDGVVDAGETCDDGALNSDTTPGACRTTCVVPSCGDNVVDPGEMCDEGVNNSDTDPDACRTTCVNANCGDGVLDAGEACDDGAANGTDPNGCELDCTLPPECGDGFVDAGEECDDGALNSDEDADACRTDCTNPICGDGVVDAGEECDAGADPSDTCDSDCVIIDEGGDMGMGGDDMGMANNANNTTPDMGGNNDPNNGTGDDMGGDESDMDNGGNPPTTDPAADDGCCRTIKRAEDDSGVAGWLAMLAIGLIALRRRR